MTIEKIIQEAIKEDIGSGDHSSLLSVPDTAYGRAELVIKDDGILAGVDVALEVFRQIDKTLETKIYIRDGKAIKKGDVVFLLDGKVQIGRAHV